MSTLASLKHKFNVGNNFCLKHSAMISKNHWLYCPHCGVKLQFVAKCKECGRNFTSEKSYNLHVHGKFDEIQKISTQHYKEVGGKLHRIVFSARRGVFYCCDCRKELKLSPDQRVLKETVER